MSNDNPERGRSPTGVRPLPYLRRIADPSLGTTGAPRSGTSGGAGAGGAGISGGARPVEVSATVELPSAIPAFLEALREAGGEGGGVR